MNNTFGHWEVSAHDGADQEKRRISSRKKDCTPLSIDGETGQFKGSHGQYTTSLDSCTCVDFVRRKLPCKHIYRFAFETTDYGKEFDVETDSHKSERLDISDVLPLLEGFSPEEQQNYADICYHCGNYNKDTKNGASVPLDFAARLIDAKLAVDINTDEYYINQYLNKLKKNELLEMLPPGSDCPDLKTDIIAKIAATMTLDDILPYMKRRHLVLPDNFSHLARTIHKRILTKYPRPHDYFMPSLYN